MYHLHCQGAFASLERGMESARKAAEDNRVAIEGLTSTVRNGIYSRVESLDRRMWAVTGGVVVQLVGIILLLVFQ